MIHSKKIIFTHNKCWLITRFTFSNLGHIDGINQLDSLSTDVPSNRTQILHNIDDIFGIAALTMGQWKVINGTTYNGQYDGWYGPAGDRDPNSYSFNNLRQSDAGNILFELAYLPTALEIT